MYLDAGYRYRSKRGSFTSTAASYCNLLCVTRVQRCQVQDIESTNPESHTVLARLVIFQMLMSPTCSMCSTSRRSTTPLTGRALCSSYVDCLNCLVSKVVVQPTNTDGPPITQGLETRSGLKKVHANFEDIQSKLETTFSRYDGNEKVMGGIVGIWARMCVDAILRDKLFKAGEPVYTIYRLSTRSNWGAYI